jgi:hypothetical protein
MISWTSRLMDKSRLKSLSSVVDARRTSALSIELKSTPAQSANQRGNSRSASASPPPIPGLLLRTRLVLPGWHNFPCLSDQCPLAWLDKGQHFPSDKVTGSLPSELPHQRITLGAARQN